MHWSCIGKEGENDTLAKKWWGGCMFKQIEGVLEGANEILSGYSMSGKTRFRTARGKMVY